MPPGLGILSPLVPCELFFFDEIGVLSLEFEDIEAISDEAEDVEDPGSPFFLDCFFVEPFLLLPPNGGGMLLFVLSLFSIKPEDDESAPAFLGFFLLFFPFPRFLGFSIFDFCFPLFNFDFLIVGETLESLDLSDLPCLSTIITFVIVIGSELFLSSE
ncbi:MAG: hypothetical protein ACRCU2_21675 [Planktothrix sp.]